MDRRSLFETTATLGLGAVGALAGWAALMPAHLGATGGRTGVCGSFERPHETP